MTVPDGIPQGLTVGQVARIIHMDERTVKSWALRGTMPFQMIGGRRYLTSWQLAGWARAIGWTLYWEEVL